ncbi:MAG: tetratricopeptide repeat protein [Candidatus Helarchaeota archaeon]
MTSDAKIQESTQNVLRKYLQTGNESTFLENFQKLFTIGTQNKLITTLGEILTELQKGHAIKAQELLEQISSITENGQLKNILFIFKNQIVLGLLNKVGAQSEESSLKVQVLLNKISILNEAVQAAIKMQDQRLIARFLEQTLDTFMSLGFYAIQGKKFESAFKFLAQGLELIKGSEVNFPKQYSFLLRTVSNLFLKTRNNPALFEIGKHAFKLGLGQQDPFEIAFKFIKQAITNDETTNYLGGLAEDYYNLASLYYERDMIKQGIGEIKKAQELHEQLEDRSGILNDVMLLGMLISKTGQLENALSIYENALHIAMDMDLKLKIGHLNLLLGTLRYSQGQYEESIKHLKTALVIFKQTQTGSDTDLIESYTWIGQTLRDMHKLTDASNFLTKILEVEQKSQSPLILLHVHAQLALTFLLQENFEAFNTHYKETLALIKDLHDDLLCANFEYQIGIGMFNTKNYQEACKHLDFAFQLYIKLANKEKLMQILDLIIFIYSQLDKGELDVNFTDDTKNVLERVGLIQEKGGISNLLMPLLSEISPSQISTKPAAEMQGASPLLSEAKSQLSSTVSLEKAEPMRPATSSKPARKKQIVPIAVPITDESPEKPPITPLPSPEKIEPMPSSKTQKIAGPPSPPETEPPITKLVGRQCPNCKFLVTDAAFTFCPKCATKLPTTRTCEKCGFLIADPSFKFCPKCANPI